MERANYFLFHLKENKLLGVNANKISKFQLNSDFNYVFFQRTVEIGGKKKHKSE